MPNMVAGIGLVATEEELLTFANKVRAAGGANVLEALLPSSPGDTEQCLIANALNFSCRVRPEPYGWIMILPVNMEQERAQAIAAAVECPLIKKAFYEGDWNAKRGTHFCLKLPKEIGNAAAAFDDGIAFQNYVISED